MGSNTITPPPVLHRNSSDDEILGLTAQLPRKSARREANSAGRGAMRLRKTRCRRRTSN